VANLRGLYSAMEAVGFIYWLDLIGSNKILKLRKVEPAMSLFRQHFRRRRRETRRPNCLSYNLRYGAIRRLLRKDSKTRRLPNGVNMK